MDDRKEFKNEYLGSFAVSEWQGEVFNLWTEYLVLLDQYGERSLYQLARYPALQEVVHRLRVWKEEKGNDEVHRIRHEVGRFSDSGLKRHYDYLKEEGKLVGVAPPQPEPTPTPDNPIFLNRPQKGRRSFGNHSDPK